MQIFYVTDVGNIITYWSDYDDAYHYLKEQGWHCVLPFSSDKEGGKSELWTKKEYSIELDVSYIARAYIVKEVLQ